MDGDFQYKEYKAQVPPKWSHFDKLGATKIAAPAKSGGGFIGFMKAAISKNNPQLDGGSLHATHGAVGDDDDVMDDDDVVPALGGGGEHPVAGKKKHRSWMEEMTAYCKAQDLKAEAKEKSTQLEGELRKRQQQANARREKILAAATTLPTASSSSSSALAGNASSSRHSETICAAMELETARMVHQYEDRIISRFEKREATLVKHLDQAQEKRKLVNASTLERSQYMQQVTEDKERKAHRRADEHQAAKRKQLEAEIKASDERTAALEVRLRIAREELNRRRAEIGAEVDRKINQSLKAREDRRTAYEEQLHHQIEATNQRLLEAKLAHQESVAEDRVGKALARAQAERTRQRTAQLAACERADKHRDRVITEKAQSDAAFQQAWVDRNQSRENRFDTKASRLYDQHMSVNMSIIERAHSPSPSSAPPNYRSAAGAAALSTALDRSNVAEDVLHHLDKHEQQTLAKYEKALETELAAFEHEKRFQERQRLALAELTKKSKDRGAKLAVAKKRAEDKAKARAEQIERDVRTRQVKSEKALEEMRSMESDYRQSANQEKARKAKEALELVHVTQRQELLKAMQEKDERVRTSAEAREAARVLKLQEEQEEQSRRWDETRQHIRSVQEAREASLEENLQRKEHQRERANQQRDERTIALQKHLQAEAAARATALAAQEAAFAAKRDKRRRDLNTKQAAWESSREEQLRQEREYYAHKADALDRRTDQAHASLDARMFQQANQTIAKLQRTYERTTPTLPRHLCFTPPPQRPHSSVK